KPPITLIIIAALAIYFARVGSLDMLINISIVIIGFGAVIFVHEFGHFIAAKSVGIMVEGFSLGFGPIVISFMKVKKGIRIRIFPTLLPGRDGEGALVFVIPFSMQKDGETEYRLNLIPLGGFVKMLGQEDVTSDKPSTDPRAYPNKKVWQRAVVISAGVTMNVICGALVYVIVFARGMDLLPAVVGDVLPHSPAALAGLQPGDVINEINGEDAFEFASLLIATVLSEDGEEIDMNVTHIDGSTESLTVMPDYFDSAGRKSIGVGRPALTTLSTRLEGDAYIEEMKKMGIAPGDKIVAINGSPVTHYAHIVKVLYPMPGESTGDDVSLTFEHADDQGDISLNTITFPMILAPTRKLNPKTGASYAPGGVLGMVPRQQVAQTDESFEDTFSKLEPNDTIIRFGEISNPTFLELRQACNNNNNEPVKMVVERMIDGEIQNVSFEITPQINPNTNWFQKIFGNSELLLGFMSGFDMDTPIVATVSDQYIRKYPALEQLPRGARIVAVNQTAIGNWRELINTMTALKGEPIELTYRAAADQPEQTLSLALPDSYSWLEYVYQADQGSLYPLRWKNHMELYQGETWRECVQLGFDRTYTMLAVTYMSLKGMITGAVSTSEISGPVGIMKMSYTVANEKNLNDFLSFMAMISIAVAFFNFLPIPVLDGGHMVMLLIEKIKGSPVSMRAQEIASYTGLFALLALVVFVTFHDILKIITDQI
ncbi:MAG: hypothetical protein GY869_16405, partial [Planctomycetes bacterium]|nr:hypothetical protein [Planctomycetota bacterium]